MYDTIASWMMAGGPLDERDSGAGSRARHAVIHGTPSPRATGRPNGPLARLARVVRPASARPNLIDRCVAA